MLTHLLSITFNSKKTKRTNNAKNIEIVLIIQSRHEIALCLFLESKMQFNNSNTDKTIASGSKNKNNFKSIFYNP